MRGGQGARRRRARTRPALGRVSGRIGGSRTVVGCITRRGPRDAVDPQRVHCSDLRIRHSHVELSKNFEEQQRADFPSSMQWDSNGPSIAVRPAFVAASLAASHETERQRRALKLARRRARHARFRSCPSEGLARGPDAPGRSTQIRAGVQPGPPRACSSARSSLREQGLRLPTSRRLGGKGRPCNRQSPWSNYTARARVPAASSSCPDDKGQRA